MKVIFLDVDGVLNNKDTTERSHGCIGLDKVLLDRLKGIVNATGARVVLSSTWRLVPARMAEVANALASRGIRMIGRTPFLNTYRSDEIMHWLKNCDKPVDKFIIIDDDVDACIGGHFVRTLTREGLTSKQALSCISLLNGRTPFSP